MSNQTNERRSLKQPLILLLILSVITITLMFVVPFEYRKIPMFIGLILMLPLALKANEIKEHNKKVRKLNQETAATKASADTNVHQNTKKDDLAVKDPSIYEKSSAVNMPDENHTNMDQQVNAKIMEIVHQANDMIPEEWDELYINGDINGREGGIFFYYRIDKEWIYSHDMYDIYEGYSMEEYRKDWDTLFYLAVDLQQIFRENNQPIWSKVILHVDEHMKLTTEFDYSDWYNSEYVDYEYMDYFRDEYLNQQPKHVGMDVVQQIREFKIKENSKQR